jgi:hypothetical protein
VQCTALKFHLSAKHVELAVGMRYDITANIDVEDGITNGSSYAGPEFTKF